MILFNLFNARQSINGSLLRSESHFRYKLPHQQRQRRRKLEDTSSQGRRVVRSMRLNNHKEQCNAMHRRSRIKKRAGPLQLT